MISETEDADNNATWNVFQDWFSLLLRKKLFWEAQSTLQCLLCVLPITKSNALLSRFFFAVGLVGTDHDSICISLSSLVQRKVYMYFGGRSASNLEPIPWNDNITRSLFGTTLSELDPHPLWSVQDCRLRKMLQDEIDIFVRLPPVDTVNADQYWIDFDQAVIQGKSDRTLKYVQSSLPAGIRNQMACTALYESAKRRDHTTILSISKSVTINAENGLGQTALHLASKNKSRAAVELLLEHQINPNKADWLGHTALYYAASATKDVPLQIIHSEIVNLLVENGAIMQWENPQGSGPLHVAVENDDYMMMNLFVRHDAAIDALDAMGRTPLQIAAELDRGLIVKLLLESGANVGAGNQAYGSPLELASRRGHVATERILSSTRANAIYEFLDYESILRDALLKGGELPQPLHGVNSPYTAVEVLLLNWAEDDLKIKDELKKLELTLSTDFNFSTSAWAIPSVDSGNQLMRRIDTLCTNKKAGDLLIVYYAGHGIRTNEQYLWTSSSHISNSTLDWQKGQFLLASCDADVLVILDSNERAPPFQRSGTGVRAGEKWIFGASSKETSGRSYSFTSTFVRELKRMSHRSWTKGETVTIKDVYDSLTNREQDSNTTLSLVGLTNNLSAATNLTPLPELRNRPEIASFVGSASDTRAWSSAITRRLGRSDETAFSSSSRSTSRSSLLSSNYLEDRSILAPDEEAQTVRLTGLPARTEKSDIIQIFLEKLGPQGRMAVTSAVNTSKRGTACVTFPSAELAKRALDIKERRFQAKGGGPSSWVLIDDKFDGLTCIYSSNKSTDKKPTVDIVAVHGIGGHAYESFACHCRAPAREVVWLRDELPKILEAEGVFPRVMTFG